MAALSPSRCRAVCVPPIWHRVMSDPTPPCARRGMAVRVPPRGHRVLTYPRPPRPGRRVSIVCVPWRLPPSSCRPANPAAPGGLAPRPCQSPHPDLPTHPPHRPHPHQALPLSQPSFPRKRGIHVPLVLTGGPQGGYAPATRPIPLSFLPSGSSASSLRPNPPTTPRPTTGRRTDSHSLPGKGPGDRSKPHHTWHHTRPHISAAAACQRLGLRLVIPPCASCHPSTAPPAALLHRGHGLLTPAPLPRPAGLASAIVARAAIQPHN